MQLSTSQKKHLRGLAHKLKPVVTIGDKGLSPGVMEEYRNALDHHELIKVRIRAGDRDDPARAREQAGSVGGAQGVHGGRATAATD